MLRDPSGKYYLWEEKFNSLNELVAFYRTTTIAKKRQVFLQDEEPLPKVGGVGGRRRLGDFSLQCTVFSLRWLLFLAKHSL